MTVKTPNRLINEKSPYLLQHAHNPVDWYPWGQEAFARARGEDKPIFLSVGYSTCHWCHVMERESFENAAIASILNEHFIAIKVDREERPDLDRIYMTSLQAMGQQGGWPMSMFLTPELKPFYGGTYFPPEARYGRAGFPDILKRIHEAWVHERSKVLESAGRLASFLTDAASVASPPAGPGREVFGGCLEQLSQTYDGTHGGFGGGPKFPRPVVFRFLFQHHRRTGDARALEMAEQTLQRMALGGIYDHIGGGFHRYAVDAEWRVPHFEKMLYDQAQLVHAYTDAYQLTLNPLYAEVAREVAEYVLRDMTHPEGGFFSAEDADSLRPEDPSEKGEGAFYVWTAREISAALGPFAEVFSHHYGVEEEGNAPADPQHEFAGKNILHVARSIRETARAFHLEEEPLRRMLASARQTLFQKRSARPHPHLDDKILAGWNGLVIGALARVGAVLGREDCIRAAVRAGEFVLKNLAAPETDLLLRRFRDGDARFEAHLEDYAFLADGLIELYQATLTPRWLEAAIRLTATSVRMFHDPDRGGFFDTSGRDSSVIVRLKEQYDGAEPAGNSAQVHNLLRLGHTVGQARWLSLAEGTFRLFASTLTRQPVAMPNMVAALDVFLHGPLQIVVTGDPAIEETASLLGEIRKRYLPGALLLATGVGEVREQMEQIVPQLRGFTGVGGVPTAYVCRNFTCELPVTSRGLLGRQLDIEVGRPETQTPAG